MTNYGAETETRIAEVVEALGRYGDRSIVALAGVPGTGKSFIASIAAQRYAKEPLLVKEVQFHQSFSYEEFIEGMRIGKDGGVTVMPGIFLDWNQQAHDDEDDRKYVLLVEELTRANLSSVIGELMTYLEYRDRPFFTVYSRRPVTVAKNLAILATYNPTDRTAIDIDAALLRRMRIIPFLPSVRQLAEMLSGSKLPAAAIEQLKKLFEACAGQDDYEYLMPFGHGIFAEVTEEADLHRLWKERIEFFLRRPLVEPHPFTSVIEKNYPWRDKTYRVPAAEQAAAQPAAPATPAASA